MHKFEELDYLDIGTFLDTIELEDNELNIAVSGKVLTNYLTGKGMINE